VDGAIHRAAGPQLLAECRTLGGCPTGQARITRGYQLPAPWVIHTVGPIWEGGHSGEDEILTQCYRSCFALLLEHGLRTVAFPSISTGIYGFPVERASLIAVREITSFLGNDSPIGKATVVCFDDHTFWCYRAALSQIFNLPPPGSMG
jgi:O-acetyl-ADP-ribose deacetylase (regulator of RNase III)